MHQSAWLQAIISCCGIWNVEEWGNSTVCCFIVVFVFSPKGNEVFSEKDGTGFVFGVNQPQASPNHVWNAGIIKMQAWRRLCLLLTDQDPPRRRRKVASAPSSSPGRGRGELFPSVCHDVLLLQQLFLDENFYGSLNFMCFTLGFDNLQKKMSLLWTNHQCCSFHEKQTAAVTWWFLMCDIYTGWSLWWVRENQNQVWWAETIRAADQPTFSCRNSGRWINSGWRKVASTGEKVD